MDIYKKTIFTIIGFTILVVFVLIGIFYVVFTLGNSPANEIRINDINGNPGSIVGDEESQNNLTDNGGVGTGGGDGPNTQIGVVKIGETRSPFLEQDKRDTNKDKEAIIYKVTFNGTWNNVSNSSFYPRGAHFSPVVAWSHSIKNILFEEGGVSTDGIEQMAETGGIGKLEDELDSLVNRGFVFDFDNGKVFDAPGTDEVFVEVTETFHLITVVSMIAPSPDWFVAVGNIDLMTDEGKWVESFTKDFVIYDAGTDNGKNFNSINSNTRPRSIITKLNDENIGSFTFTRL